MMTNEENDRLTRVEPGTPMGALLRSYWQPAALSEEVPPGSAPKALRLLGEDLVLFRDDQGRPGLLGLHCSHRGADLSYGRVEDGGLRCLYHGWLYDIHGRCLEQPSEPDGGREREGIRHSAYPCREAGGIIFAYMGPGEPPLLPAYEALAAPPAQQAVLKIFHECNYLQGNEGNIDPLHLSFLHRQFGGRDPSGWDLGVKGTNLPPDELYARDLAPRIEVELADFGVRIFSVRGIGAEQNYVRVSNFIMPNLSAVPAGTGADGYNLNWAVPIDDTHHWKFQLSFRRSAPIDREAFKRRNAPNLTPDRRPVRNRSNRYLQDREEMKTKSFGGMGAFFPAHDAYATESHGAIQDRMREHLVSSDQAIVAGRKLLLKAIDDVKAGRDPQHVVRDGAYNRFPDLQVISEVISASLDPKDHLRRRIEEAESSSQYSGQAGSSRSQTAPGHG